MKAEVAAEHAWLHQREGGSWSHFMTARYRRTR
jgi:hypothetical protein